MRHELWDVRGNGAVASSVSPPSPCFMGLCLYASGLLTTMVNSVLSRGFSGACGWFSEGLVFPFGLSGAFSAAVLLSIPLELLLLNPGRQNTRALTLAKTAELAGQKSIIQKLLNLSPLSE